VGLITSKEAGMVYPHEVDEAGVVVRKNVNADNQAGDPEEAEAVTGRPNDLPITEQKPALANTTMADRKRATSRKAISPAEAENKAVGAAETKTAGRRRRG
jgi:hypothetical protein